MEENNKVRSTSYYLKHSVKVKEPLALCKETLISCTERQISAQTHAQPLIVRREMIQIKLNIEHCQVSEAKVRTMIWLE